MAIRRWLWVSCVVVGAAACGDDAATNGDDGGGDIEEVGDEVGGLDGEAGDEDATPDSEVTGTDEDGDTFPEGVDCDDHDADIIPGSRRPCTSGCGSGTERCEGGAWVGCTAPTDCACDPPGDTRVVDCGNCGIASQRCGEDGLWEMPGTCMDEGECPEGDIETENCGICGSRSRICDATCVWRDWGPCEEHGECARTTEGIVRAGCPAGQIQQRRCSDSCTWEVVVGCTTDCIMTPRTGGDHEDLCVPGGPFIMGSEETDPDYFSRMPVHEVTVSPYLMDKYQVTNRRYRACVAAGACVEPRNSLATYFNADVVGHNWYPVTYILWSDAVAFCAWDGGRVLPTEAEWEKAGRGPSPREVRYPWGDASDYCSYVNHQLCGTGSWVAVNANPSNTSHYGVAGMDANILEYMADYFDFDYYSYTASTDPTGPEAGDYRSVRGCSFRTRLATGGVYHAVTSRWSGNPDLATDTKGFRCVRRPWTE